MADDQFILGGTGTDVFSGIAVSDFATALDWYQRLFGAKPSFYPNETRRSGRSASGAGSISS
jgi:hypothetical protein